METTLAPIILFVYNRPEHTRKTLQALSKNNLASESILYIYCDGTPADCSAELKKNNNLVKKVLREAQWCKEVIVVESETNKGLANSIISGITEIVNQYGKIIVLEDDLLTANSFLEYMNTALRLYETDSDVLQISGFSFLPPDMHPTNSSYFLSLSTTWGWATWKRAWDAMDFDCTDYTILKKDKKLAHQFNYNGNYNYKKMFFQQMESEKISSWGIRFYWNIFKQKGVVLFPDKSLVCNNGWDSSGKHNDSYDIFPMPNWDDTYSIKNFPTTNKIDENRTIITGKYIKKRTSIFMKLIKRFFLIIKKSKKLNFNFLKA